MIQALAACTAVIMCTQEDAAGSFKSAFTRVKGVIISGIVACLVVLLDNAIQNDLVFYILCGLGIVACFLACCLCRMPNIVARVSCITFALVTLVASGEFRLKYALLRVLGTLIGGVVAMIIAWVWDRIRK